MINILGTQKLKDIFADPLALKYIYWFTNFDLIFYQLLFPIAWDNHQILITDLKYYLFIKHNFIYCSTTHTKIHLCIWNIQYGKLYDKSEFW